VVLESFVLGAVGWVAGVANVCAAEHVRLHELLKSNDYSAAREYFFRLQPLLALLDSSGKFTQLVKAGAGLAGRDAGPPRRPLLPPIEEELEQLRVILAVQKVGWAEQRDSHCGTSGLLSGPWRPNKRKNARKTGANPGITAFCP
jgi:dihydrodipicolinate synthase/N-acetylneuraminate lyase